VRLQIILFGLRTANRGEVEDEDGRWLPALQAGDSGCNWVLEEEESMVVLLVGSDAEGAGQ
jgi:hypothetical protein